MSDVVAHKGNGLRARLATRRRGIMLVISLVLTGGGLIMTAEAGDRHSPGVIIESDAYEYMVRQKVDVAARTLSTAYPGNSVVSHGQVSMAKNRSLIDNLQEMGNWRWAARLNFRVSCNPKVYASMPQSDAVSSFKYTGQAWVGLKTGNYATFWAWNGTVGLAAIDEHKLIRDPTTGEVTLRPGTPVRALPDMFEAVTSRGKTVGVRHPERLVHRWFLLGNPLDKPVQGTRKYDPTIGPS